MYSTCRLCSSNEIEFKFIASDLLYGNRGKFKIVECQNCKTLLQDPFPNAEYLASLYNADSYYSVNTPISRRLLSAIRRRTRRLLPRPARSGMTFCDLGCGDGEVLSVASSYGYQTYGVEQEEFLTFLRKAYGDRLFSNISNAPVSFDIIRSHHSLEHVEDVNEVLAACVAKLNPGGRILIGVPNADSLIARIFGKYWYYLGAPMHTYGFSSRSFLELSRLHNLDIIKIKKYQTFRGTIGSITLLFQKTIFGSVREPSNGMFLILAPLILVLYPVNFLISLFNAGDLLEVELVHRKN